MPNLNDLSESQITESLTLNTAVTYDLGEELLKSDYKKASVLIPFVRENDEWHILFIRRAESEKDRHSGQVAFVGGKAELTDDSSIATALRETHEEIGVNPNHVNVLGKISCHYSVSNFQITPVVATLPWPYDFTLQTSEVSRTFTLPLSWLADDNNYEIRNRHPPESKQAVPVVFFKEYQGELLWGATARIILTLTQALKRYKE